MKLLIASDIHGSAYWCRALIERINAEQPDLILLLGDLLYHGPRNDLPREYAPREVIAMLNPLTPKLICVRGNCDGEVDRMVMDFTILEDAAVIADGNFVYCAVHGHHINEPKATPSIGNIVIHGHTHIPGINDAPECDKTGRKYINPGSVSIPRNDTPHSYMICEGGVFVWKELESGREYNRYTL